MNGPPVPAERAAELAALVNCHLPLEADVTGDGDPWPLVGPALLAHATGTLRSIFVLAPTGSHNDASRLLRSLYDHVVTFAWLGAKPTADRLAAWRKHDLEERLKADTEAMKAGEPLLEDAVRRQMEVDVESINASRPDLASMSVAADKHWAEWVEALEPGVGFRSFRGLYTVLFRQHSGLVHATYRGLNAVTEDLSPTRRRIVLQAPVEGRGPYGIATAVYGLGLLVAAHSVGWPSTAEVEAIFARYPS
jgi:hypothetical protein